MDLSPDFMVLHHEDTSGKQIMFISVWMLYFLLYQSPNEKCKGTMIETYYGRVGNIQV